MTQELTAQTKHDLEEKKEGLYIRIRYLEYILPLTPNDLLYVAFRQQDATAIPYFLEKATLPPTAIPTPTRPPQELIHDTNTVMQFMQTGQTSLPEDLAGDTLLTWAAKNGHTAVVRALLAKNVDISYPNTQDQTAPQLASQHGHTEILSLLEPIDLEPLPLLEEKTPSDNKSDSYLSLPGRTASSRSAPDPAEESTLQILPHRRCASSQFIGNTITTSDFLAVLPKKEKSISPGHTRKSSTALTPSPRMAQLCAHITALEIEISYRQRIWGTRLNLKDFLYMACRRGDIGSALYLLRKMPLDGLHAQIRTDKPRLGSFYAQKYREELGFERQDDLMVPIDTPLTWAVRKGHADIVTLLLQKGVNIQQENGHSERAWSLAVGLAEGSQDQGRKHILALLSGHIFERERTSSGHSRSDSKADALEESSEESEDDMRNKSVLLRLLPEETWKKFAPPRRRITVNRSISEEQNTQLATEKRERSRSTRSIYDGVSDNSLRHVGYVSPQRPLPEYMEEEAGTNLENTTTPPKPSPICIPLRGYFNPARTLPPQKAAAPPPMQRAASLHSTSYSRDLSSHRFSFLGPFKRQEPQPPPPRRQGSPAPPLPPSLFEADQNAALAAQADIAQLNVPASESTQENQSGPRLSPAREPSARSSPERSRFFSMLARMRAHLPSKGAPAAPTHKR